MVTTDNFSKWVEVHPLPNQEAETCARVLINEVICRWGCPLDLHSDQGQNFQSEIFKELCRLLEIRKTRTTAFNPKCNGVTERFNRTLIAMIKPYLEGSQENWDLWLGCLAGAYRATPHDSTHMTPNMMMIGREVTLPHEVTVGGSTPDRFEQVQNHGAYVMNVRNQLNLAHDVARKHLGKSVMKNKVLYDAKQHLRKYKVGDLVWKKNERNQEGVCAKLQKAFLGPFVILKAHNDLNYEVQLDEHGRKKVLHHDKLKPYTGHRVPEWAVTLIQSMQLSGANLS